MSASVEREASISVFISVFTLCNIAVTPASTGTSKPLAHSITWVIDDNGARHEYLSPSHDTAGIFFTAEMITRSYGNFM